MAADIGRRQFNPRALAAELVSRNVNVIAAFSPSAAVWLEGRHGAF
jgi:hypothetical protein